MLLLLLINMADCDRETWFSTVRFFTNLMIVIMLINCLFNKWWFHVYYPDGQFRHNGMWMCCKENKCEPHQEVTCKKLQ